MPDSAWCVSHDPDRVVELAEWRKRGGEGRSNRARARRAVGDAVLSPVEVQGLLSTVLQGVIGGTIEPGVGTASANIARALNEISKTTEVIERIESIERRLGSKAS